jgi:putative tricarboxylic transport membrane protein
MKTWNVKYERITAVGLLVGSLAYTILGLRYKLGHLANPGSGLMPMIVGFLLTGCSAVYLFNTLKIKSGGLQQENREEGWWGRNLIPICISVLVIVYPFLLKKVDFIISTILTVWSILALLRYKSVLISGMIAIAISVSLLFIFSMLLNVPLPSGDIEAVILNLW